LETREMKKDYLVKAIMVAGVVESAVWFVMKHDFTPALHRSTTPDSVIGIAAIAAGTLGYLFVAASARADAQDGETRHEQGQNDGTDLLSALGEAVLGALFGLWIALVVIIASSILIPE